MFGEIAMPLSLRTTMTLVLRWLAWFRASSAMPPVSAPSPMTATTWCFSPARSRASAMPRAADIDVLAWPVPNGSCGLSAVTGEAGEAAVLAQRREAVAAAGQELVDVGLVAHVPDELVAGAVEDAVQGDRQLDDAEVRRQVAAVLGDGAHQQRRGFPRQAAPAPAGVSAFSAAGVVDAFEQCHCASQSRWSGATAHDRSLRLAEHCRVVNTA